MSERRKLCEGGERCVLYHWHDVQHALFASVPYRGPCVEQRLPVPGLAEAGGFNLGRAVTGVVGQNPCGLVLRGDNGFLSVWYGETPRA